MSDEKSCQDCRYRRREQTGPHLFAHHCELHQIDFPDGAYHCNSYHPGPDPTEDEGEWWPKRKGWEVTT